MYLIGSSLFLFLFSSLQVFCAETVSSESVEEVVSPFDIDNREISDFWTKTCLEQKKAPPTSIPNVSLPEYTRVNTQQLPLTLKATGNLESLKVALERQIKRCPSVEKKFKLQIDGAVKEIGSDIYCKKTNQMLLKMLEESSSIEDFLKRAKSGFSWIKPTCDKKTSNQNDFQFTGYYSPVFQAKKERTSEYKYPIYNRPDDIVQQKTPEGVTQTCRKVGESVECPYPSRQQLEKLLPQQRKSDGSPLVIAYVKDPFEAMLLEVQGSGQIEVTQSDGSKQRILLNYNGSNGHSNHLLGKIMRCQGVALQDRSTILAMKSFYQKYSVKIQDALKLNPSFSFFKEGGEGPTAATGVVVTKDHTLAVDRNVFPLHGAILYTSEPSSQSKATSMHSLGLASDVGGAIKKCHIDVYRGSDESAYQEAATMNDAGSAYLALPIDF